MTALRVLLLCVVCFALGALFVTALQRIQNHMRRVSRGAEGPPLDARLHASRQSQFALLHSRDRIVLAGDSRIDEGEWDDLLGRDDVSNRGISGDTTAGLLARFGETFPRPFEVCVLQIGINDLMQGTPVAQVDANFRKIVQQLQDRKLAATIVLTSVLLTGQKSAELNGRVQELNSRLMRMAEERGLTWVDLNQRLAPKGYLESSYTNDGTHLTGQGYNIFAAALKPHLPQETPREL